MSSRSTAQADRPTRVLATILITAIVDSTAAVARIGDRHWPALLETQTNAARRVVESRRGWLIRSTGDGILATFDGLGRLAQCPLATHRMDQPTQELHQSGILGRAGERDEASGLACFGVAHDVSDHADPYLRVREPRGPQ